MRDVVAASKDLAARVENQRFRISLSQLSEIEAGALPNLYRLCSLSLLYDLDLLTLASWFIPELAELGQLQSRQVERVLFDLENKFPRSA